MMTTTIIIVITN